MEINKRKTSLYRVFGCLLALALAWGALPALAEVTHGVVTGDKVLFRKEITGSDFWDRLDRGWVARVLDESKSGGYTWYKVETNIPVAKNRTYTGYIRGDFFRMLTQAEETAWLVNKPQPDPSLGGAAGDPPEKTAAPDSAPDGEATGTLTITKKSTNLRREPGGTSLFQYPIGEVLNYYGAPVFSGGYGWAYVIYSARCLRGYVRSECYSLGGGSWTTVRTWNVDTQNMHETISLSSYVAGQANVKLKAATTGDSVAVEVYDAGNSQAIGALDRSNELRFSGDVAADRCIGSRKLVRCSGRNSRFLWITRIDGVSRREAAVIVVVVGCGCHL